jgi:NitT/TauT family transport system ATP-binding protein
MGFQNPIMLPWRTILRNVMLPLEVVEPHRRRLRTQRAAYVARARALLSLVGLGEFETRFPWQLSGGMQQRASLCRALIHEPALLMLDEPFGALDVFTREDLWAILQDLWMAQRPTVVLVTHDLREAVFLADRVLVMSARPGSITAERRIPFPRPRRLEHTYEQAFTDIVHGLRDQISAAREAGHAGAASRAV